MVWAYVGRPAFLVGSVTQSPAYLVGMCISRSLLYFPFVTAVHLPSFFVAHIQCFPPAREHTCEGHSVTTYAMHLYLIILLLTKYPA